MTSERCLHEIFQEQVDRTPTAPALICGGQWWSYAELDQRSSRLARRLRQYGAGPGRFVAIYLGRSELPILAVLACHKSGAAYIPMDPHCPREFIHQVRGELGLVLCLTEARLLDEAADDFAGVRLVVLDPEGTDIDFLPASRLSRSESGVSPQDLACVVYTSDRTGGVRGLMIEHRQVACFVDAFDQVCATDVGDRVYQGFSLSFDGSLEEIWLALSTGAALVVPARDAPSSGDELGQYLHDLGITYLSTVPAVLSTFGKQVRSVHTLVLRGKVIPPDLVERWATANCRVFAVYGPAEATVSSAVAECLPGRPLCLGRPLPGYELYVVDENLCEVPAGADGELVVGGATIARGYLKRPELTSERFLSAYDSERGVFRRFYRTGDLVRYNERDELEFVGHGDCRSRIRGRRFELAAVESALLAHPQIQDASATLVELGGLWELAAYVVTTMPSAVLDHADVVSIVESRVPPYLVPAYLDVLPEVPRTHGIVDRTRLPKPVTRLVRTSTTMIIPSRPVDQLAAAAWQEVLGAPAAAFGDDFFLDLDGDPVDQPHPIPTVRRLVARLEAALSKVRRLPRTL